MVKNENKLLDYFNSNEFAANIWSSKYRMKDNKTGIQEQTPDDMHLRMAKEFARVRYNKDKSKNIEQWVEYFFYVFKDFNEAIPQGRVMAGLGVDESFRSLSNCLRLPPPKDSYSSIMRTDTMLVSSAKRGCGYGIGLSNLRPYGVATTNAASTSTGVIPFGERYSNSTKEVGQEGRRGACLEDLDIRHPDSPDWAIIKQNPTKYTGANISFKLRKDFFNALEKDEDYILRFPVDTDNSILESLVDLKSLEYNKLIKLDKNIYVKKIKTSELWNSAIHTVWSDGCPGMQFWDQMIDYDPSNVYEKYFIDGTNACGEQPMAVYDTCRLLVINLIRVIKQPFSKSAYLDKDYLYKLCYQLLEIGDDLIDLEIEYINRIIDKIKSDNEPEDLIELELWENVLDIAKSGRRIGAGITGLADMLAAMNIKYDSKEALEFVDSFMRIKFEAELNANVDLAIKYGTFEGWNPELEKDGNSFYKMIEAEFPNQWKKMQKYGRRMVNWSTIAPVGTTSIICKVIDYFNISAGCEPQFALYFFRNKKVENKNDSFDFTDEVGIRWKQYPIVMGAFRDWYNVYRQLNDLGEMDNMSPIEIDTLFTLSPWYKAIAPDINWKFRVEMQAVLQKYTTSAISSTINLPNNVEEKVISDIYLYANEKGLKGITCYRDGSKTGVLVNKAVNTEEFAQHEAPKRPQSLDASIFHLKVRGMDYTVAVGELNDKPYEIFATEGKALDGCEKGIISKKGKGHYHFICDNIDEAIAENMSDEQATITRMLSTSLRHGADVKFIVEQLNKTKGDLTSFSKALARTLKKYIPDNTKIKGKCLDCGSEELIYREGCQTCMNCGGSKCG